MNVQMRMVLLPLALVLGCGGRERSWSPRDPGEKARLDAEVGAVAGKSSDEVAGFVLGQMFSKYDAHNAPPPVTYAIRELYRRDPQFVEKVMAEGLDPARHSHDRGKLFASLGLVGEDAAPAVPRLVAVMVDRSLGEASPVRSGASMALRGIGRPVVPAMMGLIRTGTPEQAAAAVSHLGSLGESARPAMPLVLGRIDGSMGGRELVDLLKVVQEIDRGALRSREARAVLPRVLAIAEGREEVDQELTAMEAASLLRDMGVGADVAVPAMVRLVAKTKDEEGAGWGALGMLELMSAYGGAVGGQLEKLARDGDPAVREGALVFMAVPEVGPGGAVGAISRALREDPVADVREAAAGALGKMGRRARGAVRDLERAAREDPDAEVREEAGEALLEIRN